jgi:hypothetical protein
LGYELGHKHSLLRIQVLDPFCGCGTAVHAAQKLGRKWIGIDITHLAVNLIEKRLKSAFPDIKFETFGTPKDLTGAVELARRDKYQFQWWACSLVNAQPFQDKKKGADGGIDGIIYFQDGHRSHQKVVVSVKGGESVGVTMIRELAQVVKTQNAAIGAFVSLAQPTKPMMTEALREGFYKSPNGFQVPKIQILTIEDIFAGKNLQYLDLAAGSKNYKRAKEEVKKGKQYRLFEG